MPPHHALHAQRQRDGDHGRQRLRHHGDGERNAEDQHLQERLTAEEAEGYDEHDDGEAAEGQHAAHPVEVALQRRPPLLEGVEHAGNAAELGLHAGGSHHRPAAAVGAGRAGPDHVGAVAQLEILRQRTRGLVDRRRLAGESGLLDFQVHRLDEAGVGRDEVAGLDEQDVPRDHLARRDLALLAVAHHRGHGRRHAAQGLDGLFGAEFLHEPEEHREDRDDGDHRRLQHVAQEGGEHDGREEQEDEDVLDLIEQDRPGRDPPRRAQLVRPVLRKPALRLGPGKPAGRVRFQPLQSFRDLQPVPVAHLSLLAARLPDTTILSVRVQPEGYPGG